MRLKKLVRIGLVSIMLLPFSLFSVSAQIDSVSDTLELDLEKALEIALSDNPTIIIAEKQIQIKRHYKQQQIASLIPTVDASFNYSRALKKQIISIGGVGTVEMGSDNSYNAGLNLNLPIVAPVLWATIKLSELDISMSLESARSSKLSMINEVRKAYYQYLLTQESYNVLLLSYANMQEDLQNIVDKFAQGLVSEYDKIRTEVQLQNMRPQIVSAKNGIYLAELQLRILLGLDTYEKIKFIGHISDYENRLDDPIMSVVSEAIKVGNSEVLASNSELKQIDIQAQQLEKAADILKAQYYPTLGLTANYGLMSMNDNFKFGSYSWYPNSSIGLGLSIPIFQGTKVRQQIKQKRLEQESLEIQKNDIERQLKMAIQSSLSNMATAIEEISFSKNNIRQAEKSYEISSARYDVGSGTVLEVKDSELSLTQARLSYTQSIYNYLIAYADLKKILGDDTLVQSLD